MSEMNEIVYYSVTPPGAPDIFHESESCAGDYTKETTRREAVSAGAEPCSNCAI